MADVEDSFMAVQVGISEFYGNVTIILQNNTKLSLM